MLIFGEAGKNLYNNYFNSEEAPKESSEYITKPLEQLAYGASGEGAGQLIGRGIHAASKSVNPVSEFIKKRY